MAPKQRGHPANDLGVWLDGHDRARLRLHQAYLIVQRRALDGRLDAAAFAVPANDLFGDVRTARIGTDYYLRAMVKSWLRWLDPGISLALAGDAVDGARDVLVEHLAEGVASDSVAAQMVAATDRVLSRGLGYGVLLWEEYGRLGDAQSA